MMVGFIYVISRVTTAVRLVVLFLLGIAIYSASAINCVALVESENAISILAGRTACGVQSFFNEELISYNGRLLSAYNTISLLEEHDAWWHGFGLNSSSVFVNHQIDGVQENSIWLSLALFYGVFAVAIIAFFFVFLLVRIRQIPIELGAIYSALLVAATINSAQGFYLYGLLFVFAIVVYNQQSAEIASVN
jgi:hypothetical protein